MSDTKEGAHRVNGIAYIDEECADSNRKRRLSNPSSYSDSSSESFPVDAPLVRQTRCSIDIDTVPPLMKSSPTQKIRMIRGKNAYLDNLQLSDSFQEIV